MARTFLLTDPDTQDSLVIRNLSSTGPAPLAPTEVTAGGLSPAVGSFSALNYPGEAADTTITLPTAVKGDRVALQLVDIGSFNTTISGGSYSKIIDSDNNGAVLVLEYTGTTWAEVS